MGQGPSTTGSARSIRLVWIAAVVLGLAALAARWPGVAMWDSIAQYEQASSGRYQDWHPPIMALLWSATRLVHPGTGPMLVLQLLGWWGGLGLIAAALAREGRGRAAAWVIAIGACPLWLGWETVVLKDCQMAAALLLATGLAAHWRLAGRAIPRWAVGAIVVLLAYATLVRGNAVFATVPLACALTGWGGIKGHAWRLVATLAAMAAVIGLAPVVNRGLIGAQASGVERALPLYDLVGIATYAPLDTLPGITAAEWAEVKKRGCYTPYFWNPFGEVTQCGFAGRDIAFEGPGGAAINRTWAKTILAHPLAYAEHRLVHLNSNLRFIVGAREPDAVPPLNSETNAIGLGAEARAPGRSLVEAARFVVRTPIARPCVWLIVAAGLLWASWGATGARAMLGRALAFSAAMMSVSFAMISIASDLRYHLWSMVAAALATVLLSDAKAIRPERLKPLLAVIVVVALIAGVARQTAPRQRIPPGFGPPPASFTHWQ